MIDVKYRRNEHMGKESVKLNMAASHPSFSLTRWNESKTSTMYKRLASLMATKKTEAIPK